LVGRLGFTSTLLTEVGACCRRRGEFIEVDRRRALRVDDRQKRREARARLCRTATQVFLRFDATAAMMRRAQF
jgi:hypothetical protein